MGTGDQIAQLVADSGSCGVEVVSNPEFLRQGTAIRDFLEPDRIVVGAALPAAGAAVAYLYNGVDAPVIMCSRRSAELAKYAANALLATRISFINEVSVICERAQADVEEVARIVGSDIRIGSANLSAGLGWGGSCFPKDLRALAATAAAYGCHASIVQSALEVNARQVETALERLRTAIGSARDATVCVLGLAFKPNTDDVRGAPALDVIRRLLEEGVRVRAHDPVAMANACGVLPNVDYCRDAYDAAIGSDALLLATEWPDYLTLDWKRMRSLMRGGLLLDGRNALNGRLLSAMGFTYLSFGRSGSLASNGHFPEPQAVPDLAAQISKP